MNKTIVYLHGFLSSPSGEKYDKVSALAKRTGNFLVSPNIPTNPYEAIKEIQSEIKDIENPIFIGTSLGGFYSLYFSQLLKTEAVVINPSLHPSITFGVRLGGKDEIKVIDYSGKSVLIKHEFIDMFETLEEEIELVDTDNIHCFVGTNDAIINPIFAKEFFAGSNLYEYDSDHRFTSHWDEVVKTMEALL